jgi:hypothetical protein
VLAHFGVHLVEGILVGFLRNNLHTAAYVSIRQHTSAYVSTRQHRKLPPPTAVERKTNALFNEGRTLLLRERRTRSSLDGYRRMLTYADMQVSEHLLSERRTLSRRGARPTFFFALPLTTA